MTEIQLSLEAVCGCVPPTVVDNRALLAELVGAAKADALVKSTGFPFRRVAAAGQTVYDLALPAARRALDGIDPATLGGVVAVTFSAPDRFPALSIRLHQALGLPADAAAFDLSLACSGYPYGLFAAAQLAAATGRRVLLVDGDVQSAHVDTSDVNTLAVMSDAATATLIAPGGTPASFAFLTDGTGADVLRCGADGKIRMDAGQHVHGAPAREVARPRTPAPHERRALREPWLMLRAAHARRHRRRGERAPGRFRRGPLRRRRVRRRSFHLAQKPRRSVIYITYQRMQKKWQIEPASTNMCQMGWWYGSLRHR